ncbi:MAG: transcription antitermination factor NusB [Ruminococcus sp.]|nr:transcription antitermination factor NusB [Ruminococcus sp.]
MKRHEIRECAFLILFETQFREDSTEELYSLAEDVQSITVNQDVKNLVEGTISHKKELNSILEKYSKKRAIHRIPKLHITILQLAFYEILFEKNIPLNVAISEAIQLAQDYGCQEDVSFINGVLGEYSRNNTNTTEA